MARFVKFVAFLVLASVANAKDPVVDLVRVEKSKRLLHLVSDGKTVATFSIALGGSPTGHKQEEGDRRTPEGRYVLDYKKSDSAYFRSIHISYPNSSDSEAAEARGVSPGGFIMIHGQRNGFGWAASATQRFDWTDGCIALTNEDMLKVWNSITVPTPIEIEP
jgi:murein L,D-transpeptidase YafK